MKNLIRQIIRQNRLVFALALIAVIAISVVVIMLVQLFKSSEVALDVDQKIDNTPISVERMRQIGEWEFLTISDEEIVDTIRKGFFHDDELARIYYGELRLGVDMKEMKDDAILQDGDSIRIILPEIKLLDDDFIDEARTRSFYETGKWSGSDREALYVKAKQKMKAHCLTKENMETAKDNATTQITRMLKTLGVEKVNVR